MQSSLVLTIIAGTWMASVWASSETHDENVPDGNDISFLQANLEFQQRVDEASTGRRRQATPTTPTQASASCGYTKVNRLWPRPIDGGGGRDGRWNYCHSSFIGSCAAGWSSESCSSDADCFAQATAKCDSMTNCVSVCKDGYGYNLRDATVADHAWSGDSWQKGQCASQAPCSTSVTNGVWYAPLGSRTVAASGDACRQRCVSEGAAYFNKFPNGGCHCGTASATEQVHSGNPTEVSGPVSCSAAATTTTTTVADAPAASYDPTVYYLHRKCPAGAVDAVNGPGLAWEATADVDTCFQLCLQNPRCNSFTVSDHIGGWCKACTYGDNSQLADHSGFRTYPVTRQDPPTPAAPPTCAGDFVLVGVGKCAGSADEHSSCAGDMRRDEATGFGTQAECASAVNPPNAGGSAYFNTGGGYQAYSWSPEESKCYGYIARWANNNPAQRGFTMGSGNHCQVRGTSAGTRNEVCCRKPDPPTPAPPTCAGDFVLVGVGKCAGSADEHSSCAGDMRRDEATGFGTQAECASAVNPPNAGGSAYFNTGGGYQAYSWSPEETKCYGYIARHANNNPAQRGFTMGSGNHCQVRGTSAGTRNEVCCRKPDPPSR